MNRQTDVSLPPSALAAAREIANCDDGALNESIGRCYSIPPCRLHAAIAETLVAWGEAQLDAGYDAGMREGQKQAQEYEECGKGFYTSKGDFLPCDKPRGHSGNHSGVL